MITDPIADLLTRIRNALHARHQQVIVPHSRLREAICRSLVSEGFIEGLETGGEKPKQKIILRLRYAPSGEPVIHGISRVSKPSMRRYTGAAVARLRGGLGVQILTTPIGVMTDREARRKRVGGEILVAVW
jgi:small subunit ribosomal protein S8